MEIRLSLVLLALLLALGEAMSAGAPAAVLPASPELQALAALEDSVAGNRRDLSQSRSLTASYLRMGLPGLAVAAVRAAPPEVARDPVLTHRLAQAYEASGRVEDAFATAQVARARCLCSLRGSELCEEIPRCTVPTLAALETHAEALEMLVRWRVTDPRHDTRTALAYRLAHRTARIASLGLTEPAQ